MDMFPHYVQALAVFMIFLVFGLADLLRQRFFTPLASREDNRLDVAVIIVLPMVIVPFILLTCTFAGQAWFPAYSNALGAWPWWWMAVVLLLADDLTQYLWHRFAHTRAMWPFHRAHHSAAYMGVRTVYRNNVLYYLFMPGLWLSGILVFLGFGWVYVGYTTVKMLVIVGAHSEARWDEKLYQMPLLHPVMWVVERTISTPATHFAHHALSNEDGVGNNMGNFGNLLFFWDVLFGTALITRHYPPQFGLPDDRRHGAERWHVQVFYPLFRSRRKQSVLGKPQPGAVPEV